MSEDMFKQYSDKLGLENLNAEITDGKFIITPAEAGIAIMGYIEISEQQMSEKDNEIAVLTGTIDWLKGDNANLRDILERCYSVLIETGHEALAEECIELAYPIFAINSDGEVFKEETNDNE